MVPARLDHIVIVVPYNFVQDPPSWLTSVFTITPGGTHADGKTCNKLVIFEDGTYLEFIAFVGDDPENRKDHHWGDKPFGFADYAFTTNGSEETDALRKRLAEEIDGLYNNPRAGGRKGSDGKEVKWTVTFPSQNSGFKRGEIPFFCHDVTERSLRVPLDKSKTTHPCGARGVAHVSVLIPAAKVDSYVQTYGKVLGTDPIKNPFGATRLQVKRPVEVDGMREDPYIFAEEPEIPNEVELVKERGAIITEVALGIPSGGGVGFARPPLQEGGICIQFLKR